MFGNSALRVALRAGSRRGRTQGLARRFSRLPVGLRSLPSTASTGARRHFRASRPILAAKRDYYDVLGVPRDADKKQIKKAYYKVRPVSSLLVSLFARVGKLYLCMHPIPSAQSYLSSPLFSISLESNIYHYHSWLRSTIQTRTRATRVQQRSSLPWRMHMRH
jgi:hypothetical protein